MKKICYLAIDIGASSGRHMVGWLEEGKLELREIYRFPNGMREKNGRKCWDGEALFSHVLTGMKKCRELGMTPDYMGIDTWGVDFVLLDGNGRRLGDFVGYRDSRTEGMEEKVFALIPEKELYLRTGIQKAVFNTIYQLMAVREQTPELLEKADTLLMTPDYLNYLLTGEKTSEYTIASTTQLLNPLTGDWDRELIKKLGIPEGIFRPVRKPGAVLGPLTEEVSREVGYSCKVVLVASHDTASAVLAVPSADEFSAYISSGTWSLMGVELPAALCTEAGMRANLTNEGGYSGNIRYLKNIMGLWMIQSVRHELDDRYSFDELCQMAEESKIPSLVDGNDPRFFAPDSMIGAVQNACRESGQTVPVTPGEIAAVIYRSLAASYGETLCQLSSITGRKLHAIHIVGGGCNASLLNRLTAQTAGVPVYAGPSEATAIGNLTAQLLCSGEFSSVAEARECIFRSFSVKTYLPEN